MSIAALQAVTAASGITALPATEVVGTTTDFDSVLNSLRDLNTRVIADEQAVANLALGGTDNLHQVMMTLEQTRLSFELMLAVRTKLLEAYQELARMQV